MTKKCLIAFVISMLPIIELRGAMPYALAFNIPLAKAYAICIIGNMIPVPFIYLFARRILVWGSRKRGLGRFFRWCLEKGAKGGEKLKGSSGKGYGIFIALILFVGVPLPGTGAWTGTLAASILDIGFKRTVVAVLLGVLLAGVIMATGSSLVLHGIRG